MVVMRTGYVLRPITPDEVAVFMRRVETSFGVVPTEEAVARETASFDCDRSLAVIRTIRKLSAVPLLVSSVAA